MSRKPTPYVRRFGYTPIDVDELYWRDGGRCQICKKPVPITEFVLDHIIPKALVREALDERELNRMDDPLNAQVAHRVCNIRRHNNKPAQIRLF